MNMNATLINGGKVHRIIDGFARCGVGRNAKTRTWQMEIGDVTCLRCMKLERVEAAQGRKEVQPRMDTDKHRYRNE